MLEPKVTVMSADSAFITGRSVIKNGTYKDPNVKTPIDISGEYRFLDVYARRNGTWQVIASQATKVDSCSAAPPQRVRQRQLRDLTPAAIADSNR